MRNILIAFSALFFLALTSYTSAENKPTTVGKDIANEKLQQIAAIGYDNIDFTVSRLQFVKEFRGAMEIANDDEAMGVTHYGIQGLENDYDIVGFMFLDDQLMSLLFTYQEDKVHQLGGVSTLKAKVRKKFGTPTNEKETSDIWLFPTVDRKVVGVSHDKMWTLGIHRTSLSKTLEAAKLKIASVQNVPSEQADQNPEVEKLKEGWVYWQPTAAERAEMETEAKAAGIQRLETQPRNLQITPPGLLVTRKQYGDRWPFTIPEGYVESINYALVFHTPDHKTYALNGIAMGKNYLDIEPIWLSHPSRDGLKVSVGPLIEAARSTRTVGARVPVKQSRKTKTRSQARRNGNVNHSLVQTFRDAWRKDNMRRQTKSTQAKSIVLMQLIVSTDIDDLASRKATLDYIQSTIDSW